MKYLLILIAFTANGCMGQYPLQKAYQKKDTAKYKVDTIYNTDGPLYVLIQFDSSKYFWKKHIYWEGRLDKELDRLNKSGKAKYLTKDLLRYQDSAVKYKLLLDRLKK